MEALDQLLLGLYHNLETEDYCRISEIIPFPIEWRNVARLAYENGFIEYPVGRSSYSTIAKIT